MTDGEQSDEQLCREEESRVDTSSSRTSVDECLGGEFFRQANDGKRPVGGGTVGSGVIGDGAAVVGIADHGTPRVGTAGVGTAGEGTAGVGIAGEGTAGVGIAGVGIADNGLNYDTKWSDERWARAVLTLFVEADSAYGRQLRTDSAATVLRRLLDERPSLAEHRAVANRDYLESSLRRLQQPAGLLVPADTDWPPQLDDLHAPPIALWWRGFGRLRHLCSQSVAVVGARAATNYGERVAIRMASEIASKGWTVISGGAFGIDAAAHRGALTAGPTVCVLASGIDVAYPVAHSQLIDTIAATGVIVSEAGLAEPARRYRFLARNRIIAALARGVVVVEAAPRSGSLGTARAADSLGRHVMGVPGPVTSETSRGVHEMLRANPHMTLVTNADEVVEMCGLVGEDLAPIADGPRDVRDFLSETARRIADHLTPTAQPLNALAQSVGISAVATMTGLSELLVAQLALSDDSGWRISPTGMRPTAR